MNRKLILMAIMAMPLIGGCTQFKKLTNTDAEEFKPDPGPYMIAEVGILPVSNVLTVTPPFDSSETLISVYIRVSGERTQIYDAAVAGPYYSFDGTTFTVYNYDGAANISGHPDNFTVYYRSPYPAGYHTMQ